MEWIVNLIASYGSIIVGDFLVAELFGLCSFILIIGICIGKWVWKPKGRVN